MASFQLLSVDCYLLTKIINKLDEDSYFRLQQTNKIMNEFIRNNKHICVHLSESYDFKLYFKDEEREKRRNEMDVECFYGVQFAKLRPSDNFFSDNPENYKKNCDLLKKCRITCEKLDLTYPCCRPSKEEIAMLINIVKPRIASVYGMYDRVDDPDRCTALLQSGSKTLKQVHVSLDLENTATLVPQLFSTFPTVNITSRICSTEQQVELLHTILKILRSQSFPNLQNFSVRAFPVDEFPSSFKLGFDEVKEKFKDLNWIYTRESKYEGDDDEEQMEEEFDYLAWGGEEDDEEESEKEENEDKEKEEVEINEDTDDDEEEETDYEDERLLYVKRKFIAILELPNGPCEIVFENDSNYTRSQLSMSLGDRERAYFF